MIGLLLDHWGLISGLLGAGGGVLSMFFPAQAMLAVRALWAWLSHRSFWQIVCMGLAALILVQHFELVRSRAEAAKWHSHFTAEHNGRIADRQAYAKAQTAAAAKNQAQVQKIEQQYQRNSDDERQGYLDDLARLRGMRGQAPSRPAGSAGSPAPHSPAAGAHANGLPVPSADDVQAAAEIELRLMHLQNWIEKQLTVDPNAP